MEFRWNDWNFDKVEQHGVDPLEAEGGVEACAPPYPSYRGDGRYLVWGRGRGGRLLQVVFVIDDDGTLFTIHARPLTESEKRRYRRTRRR